MLFVFSPAWGILLEVWLFRVQASHATLHLLHATEAGERLGGQMGRGTWSAGSASGWRTATPRWTS